MNDQYPEYAKISMHNHFGGRGANCTKDKRVTRLRQFDLAEAYGRIDDAVSSGFNLLALTNSNDLDAAAYYILRRYASLKGIELVPGAEVNLMNWEKNDHILHVVVVFSPSVNAFSLQETLRDFYEQNGKYSLDIDQLCDVLKLDRSVVCIHGIKQDKSGRSMSANPEMAAELVSLNAFLPVTFEDNQRFHKSVLCEAIKDFLTESQAKWIVETAADISAADRDPFSTVKQPTFMWAGSTFDDFYYSALVGSERMVREQDIVRRTSYISRIVIDEGRGLTASSIDCSQGLNVIVGPSGSGKTLLLDAIKRKLTGTPLSSDTSSKADYAKLCDIQQLHLYDPEGNEMLSDGGFELIEGENLYQKVIRAYSGSKEELVADLGLGIEKKGVRDLLRAFETKANAYLQQRTKADELHDTGVTTLAQAVSAAKFIAANASMRADTIPFSIDPAVSQRIAGLSKEVTKCDEDTRTMIEHFTALRSIAQEHHFPEETISALDALQNEFQWRLSAEKADKQAASLQESLTLARQKLLYDVCQEYNGGISVQYQQVNEKVQTLTDKLASLAAGLLERKRALLSAAPPVLDEKQVRDSIGFASDNDIARLDVTSVNLILEDQDSVQRAFPQSVSRGTAANKVKMRAFMPPYSLTDADDVARLLDVFVEQGMDDVSLELQPEDVLDYAVVLKTDEGDFKPIEEFSAGMLSKVYVTHFLDGAIDKAGSGPIVLYDQPESNMEKAFLLETLVDKFSKLRRTHQLFVATHEPLLVVNADANEIILASNEKKVEQPNCISYTNRSFVGAHGKSELVEEVAKLIDGGTSAVKKRSNVYEGMVNRGA